MKSKEFLCETCGYDGGWCPYPQEAHCEKYVPQDDENEVAIKEPAQTPYERTRSAVYATGNKWAIENFHATHD